MAALSSFVPMAPALHSFESAILYFVEIAGYHCTEYSVCAFSCMMDADNILYWRLCPTSLPSFKSTL